MDTEQIKSKLEKADRHLAEARNELNRPAEDVVPFMVCRSARYSISNYLQGYLLKHQTEFDPEASVEALLEKCRAIDTQFKSFDLSAITFAKDDEYSAEFDQMEGCINLAEHAKTMIGE